MNCPISSLHRVRKPKFAHLGPMQSQCKPSSPPPFSLPPIFPQLKPGFSFKNPIQATLWGAQVAALQIRFNSQDPNVSAIARKEVDILATEFQAKYKVKWGPNEEEQKKKTFTDNLWKISQINLQSNKTGWWAAQTKFADLTEQEFARKYLMTEFKTPATYDKLIKGKEFISLAIIINLEFVIMLTRHLFFSFLFLQYLPGSFLALVWIGMLKRK